MTAFILSKLENKKENTIPIEFCVCTIDLMKQGCIHFNFFGKICSLVTNFFPVGNKLDCVHETVLNLSCSSPHYLHFVSEENAQKQSLSCEREDVFSWVKFTCLCPTYSLL